MFHCNVLLYAYVQYYIQAAENFNELLSASHYMNFTPEPSRFNSFLFLTNAYPYF